MSATFSYSENFKQTGSAFIWNGIRKLSESSETSEMPRKLVSSAETGDSIGNMVPAEDTSAEVKLKPSARCYLVFKMDGPVLRRVEIDLGARKEHWTRHRSEQSTRAMKAFCIGLLWAKFRSGYDTPGQNWLELAAETGATWAKTLVENLAASKRAHGLCAWWDELERICPGARFPFRLHEIRKKNLFRVDYASTEANDDSCWAIDRLQLFDDEDALIDGVRLLASARKLEKSETAWRRHILPSDSQVRQWPKKTPPGAANSHSDGRVQVSARQSAKSHGRKPSSLIPQAPLQLQRGNAVEFEADRILATPEPLLVSVEPPVPDFVDRTEMVRVREMLTRGKPCRLAFFGPMHSGKTEMARQVAMEFTEHFTDGIFEIDLNGQSSRPVDVNVALKLIIQKFWGTASPLPKSTDQLRRKMLEVLAKKKAMLVFDNTKESNQVLPLLPPLSCSVIITSRDHFMLPGFQVFDVPMMGKSEATRLLEDILARAGKKIETFGEGLADICDQNPFAVRCLANALADTDIAHPLEFTTWLHEHPTVAREPLRGPIEISYNLLNESEKRVWRALSVFGDFALDDACHVTQVLALDESPRTIIDRLRNSSRITQNRVQVEDTPQLMGLEFYRGVKSRFKLSSYEHDFLRERLEASEDWEPIGRAHSFLFRQRLMLFEMVTNGAKSTTEDRNRIKADMMMKLDYVNFAGALAMAAELVARGKNFDREWGAFSKYLVDKRANHTLFDNLFGVEVPGSVEITDQMLTDLMLTVFDPALAPHAKTVLTGGKS